jgi:phenylalanyl-tRNA synthetase beta subunit
MRRSLVPGLFGLVEKNAGFRDSLAVFEIGSIYDPEGEGNAWETPGGEAGGKNARGAGAAGKGAVLPGERKMASALILRKIGRGDASSRDAGSSRGGAASSAEAFFELKGKLEHLFRRLSLSAAEFVEFDRAAEFAGSFSLCNLGAVEGPAQPYNGARRALLAGGRVCFGVAAELNPLLLANAGIDFNSYRAAAFEIDLGFLLRVCGESKPLKRYRKLPRFPEVLLDIAVVVEEGVPAREVREFIAAGGGGSSSGKGVAVPALLRRVELFDVYRGKPLPEGKKSLAFNLAYGSDERTLTDEEVKGVHDAIVSRIRGRGWDLRK